MPAAYPESTSGSAPPRKLLRTLVGTGLTAAVIAVAIALPDQAAAQPSLKDKLDKVSSQLKDAKSDLAELKDRRDAAAADVNIAEATIAAAPQSVTGAVDAVGDNQSAIDRLSALTGYSSSQTSELTEAAESRDDATLLIDRLNDDIDNKKDHVGELRDKRDNLKDKIAEAKAEQEAESNNDTDNSGDDSAPVSSDGDGAVSFAKDQLGESYVFGATGPDTWDCSSLTQAAWAAAGEDIGRVTYDQWDNMNHISRSQLRPGDLVFYNGQGHVAMYVGNGKVIHAPQEGDVVKYSDIDMMGVDGYTRP